MRKLCARSHCGNVATKGREWCTEHLGGTAAERGYDRRWQKVRNSYIRRNPLCEECEENGRTKAADVVDHIVSIRAGGPRLDPRNLKSLCRKCHGEKTAREVYG